MKITDPHDIAPEAPDCPDEAVTDPASPCYGKTAGRPRAADKEARQLALLHTAAQLFLEKGYSKVSLEMIAREAHVAVRTIYVKFGGKAGLLSAVISKGRARFFADMTSMETDPRPLEEILSDFSLRFLELVSLPSFVSLHRMVVAEATSTPELADTFYQAGPRQSREQLTRLFVRPEIRARLRPELPLELLAVHLTNCLLGDHMARLLFPEARQPTTEELRQQAAMGLDLFLRSVLR
ncbi:AcrR family transcriptional regulator [Duganella sp. 1411]|uniref:TetR/AcrR family transcriptional regulator n=1 Tax=Duganella sp. 1411 TaxID=2806572 RepID=UPI001AE50659|nr:TetR/AcrR family transcriptional regulator [Duganella sp. 1411]MBP1208186.1 AcrR family transcriptional regulator [Duganella sp. 1411]